jgi:hypothetical protein
MKYLSESEEQQLRVYMESRGLNKRSIDSYLTSIRKSCSFFEVSVLEQIKLVNTLNKYGRNDAAEYIYNIYSKANPMNSKQAYDFKSHLRMAASYALEV